MKTPSKRLWKVIDAAAIGTILIVGVVWVIASGDTGFGSFPKSMTVAAIALYAWLRGYRGRKKLENKGPLQKLQEHNDRSGDLF